jgi:hypothetical protein
MFLYYAKGDGKTESCSLTNPFCGKERFKDAFPVLGRDPRTRIRHLDNASFVSGSKRVRTVMTPSDPIASRHSSTDSSAPAPVCPVSAHRWEIGRKRTDNGNAVETECVLDNGGNLHDDLIQIERLHHAFGIAGKAEQVGNDFPADTRILFYQADMLTKLGPSGKSSAASCAYPRIMPSGVLISCATPAASRPIDSSRCAFATAHAICAFSDIARRAQTPMMEPSASCTAVLTT